MRAGALLRGREFDRTSALPPRMRPSRGALRRLVAGVETRQVGIAGRTAWGVADQAVSSLTNFGLGVLVARVVSVRDFGAFALAFAAYVTVINVGNGLISQPFLVRYSNVPDDEWRPAAATASGTALSLGLTSGLVCLITGLAVNGTVGRAFVALSLTLPGLVLQDTWRYIFFARRRGSSSFANDLAWGMAFLPVAVVLSATKLGTASSLILAWGCAATFAAVVGCVQGKTLPKPSTTLRWLSDQRYLASRFLAEVMVGSGVQQLTVFAIGAVAGLEAVGGIRGAEMLLGPLYVVIVGIGVMAVPEAIAVLQRSANTMRRNLLRLASALSAVAFATGTVAYLLPERGGMAILGASWTTARPALLPVAVFMAGLSAAMGAVIGLRALAAAKRSLRAQMYTAPLILVGGAFGAAFGGAPGGAGGMAIGMWLSVAIWWHQFKLAFKDYQARLCTFDSEEENATDADSPRPI